MGFLVILILILIYSLPTIVACVRGHHNRIAIYATNWLVGWTAIGWVVALIWALTATEGKR